MNSANHPPTPPAAAAGASSDAPATVRRIPLCASGDLREAGEAVPFDVIWRGQTCRAFAIRWQGQVHAYLNRCSHIPMEMDYQPNRFFDDSGQWLLCATHGAAYRPGHRPLRGRPLQRRAAGSYRADRSGRPGALAAHRGAAADRLLKPKAEPQIKFKPLRSKRHKLWKTKCM